MDFISDIVMILFLFFLKFKIHMELLRLQIESVSMLVIQKV